MKFWMKIFTTLMAIVLFVTFYLLHLHVVQTFLINKEPWESRVKETFDPGLVILHNSSSRNNRNLPQNVCTNSLCLSLLSAKEFAAYQYCERQVQNITGLSASLGQVSCRFMNGTGRKPVALVSETGSGNTWVRGLLEKGTGICTGAIYCDPALRNNGMVGEFVTGSSVLVVKTHTPDYQWEGVAHPNRASDPEHEDGNYGAAILLVRNPFDAFVSEWNRFVTLQKPEATSKVVQSSVVDESHTFSLGKKMFGLNPEWNSFLYFICKRWYNVYTRWFASAVTYNIPILVVHYEKIKENKISQVERMLDFLKFEFNHDFVTQKLYEDYTMFRRNHSMQFEHYTTAQIRRINNYIRKAARYLKQYDVNNVFMLESYLRI